MAETYTFTLSKEDYHSVIRAVVLSNEYKASLFTNLLEYKYNSTKEDSTKEDSTKIVSVDDIIKCNTYLKDYLDTLNKERYIAETYIIKPTIIELEAFINNIDNLLLK